MRCRADDNNVSSVARAGRAPYALVSDQVLHAEGAKAEGKYKGRPVDQKRHKSIADMLTRGMSWKAIMDATDCSRTTVAAVAKTLKQAA